MNHSYEHIKHIRKTTVGVITRIRESNFDTLKNAVAEALAGREGGAPVSGGYITGRPAFSASDSRLFVEVFWDLFREGITTLGANAENPGFPWFRASRLFDEKVSGEGS